MNPIRITIFLILFSYLHASAQVMNVRKWRKLERDSIDNAMYLIDENQFLDALPIFDALLKNHPKEEFLRYTYAKCALYRADKHEDAYIYLSELYEKNKKIPEIQLDMAKAAHFNYKFDEATKYTNIFLTNRKISPEQRREAEMLIVYIGNARHYYNSPTGAFLNNLGAGINSDDDEYVPAITADESKLIFTYRGKKSQGGLQNNFLQPDALGTFMEDIYSSQRVNGRFIQGTPITSLNSNAPDAAVSLSYDGSHLFLYRDLGDGHGDIYISTLLGDSFSEPEKLRGEINSYSWDGHCSLSPDGKILYFSSDRGGGFGGRDLYKVTLQEDSTWSNAVNLGDSINTPFDEDAPFIHADGRTLYYSSNGSASMGGYDVFRAAIAPGDSVFKGSKNLGYPINSAADDRYFVITADNKHAYYSTARKEGFGRYDIYQIETNFTENLNPVYLVKGKTSDKTKAVKADILVALADEGGKPYQTYQSNPITGEYLICLPGGQNYKLTYKYPERDDLYLNANAGNIEVYTEKINNIDFTIPLGAQVLATNVPTSIPSPSLASASTNTVATKIKEAVKTVTKTVSTETTNLASTSTKTTASTDFTAGLSEPVKSEPVAVATKTKVAEPIVKKTESTNLETTTAVGSPTSSSFKPNWNSSVLRDPTFPQTALQEKTLRFAERFGAIKAPDLEFRVQLSAVKIDHNTVFPNQARLGKIEKIDLADGFIRITAGGTFATIGEAFEHNRKVVKAGQREGFVIAVYKGKKVTYDYLVEIGVFK